MGKGHKPRQGVSRKKYVEGYEAAFPKLNVERDKKYRLWIASHPCLLSDKKCVGQVIPHHIYYRARCTDYLTVPLCSLGHHKYGKWSVHELTREPFEKFHNIDLKEEAERLRREYELR
jgi:hypothetical protein